LCSHLQSYTHDQGCTPVFVWFPSLSCCGCSRISFSLSPGLCVLPGLYLVCLGSFRFSRNALRTQSRGTRCEKQKLSDVRFASAATFKPRLSSSNVVQTWSHNSLQIMSTSYIYAALDCMSYLHRPPPGSWIVRAAATFRILAFLLILPCIFLTALDVASYLIVRTLGADSAHTLEPVNGTSDYSPGESNLDGISPGPTIDEESRKPPNIMLPPQFNAPGIQAHQETYFATPLDGNFALSGEGIFSPPESRASSPPIVKHPRTSSAATAEQDAPEMNRLGTNEDSATAVLRRRG